MFRVVSLNTIYKYTIRNCLQRFTNDLTVELNNTMQQQESSINVHIRRRSCHQKAPIIKHRLFNENPRSKCKTAK